MIDGIAIYSRDKTQFDHAYLNNNFKIISSSRDDFKALTVQVKNLNVQLNNYNINISGSIPRFMNGNNIKTLKIHQLPDFIENLSELIRIDISQFYVSKIEITDNLEMIYPPRLYKRYFGKCRYINNKTDHDNGGIKYYNTVRSATFYDKLKERQDKGGDIPFAFIGKNLLRYEYSIYKNIQNLIGSFTISELSEAENYLLLISKWEQLFYSINKISFQSNISIPTKSGLDVDRLLQLAGVEYFGGIEATTDIIRAYEDMGYITKRQRDYQQKNIQKHRKLYNELSNIRGDRLQELEREFAEKVRENREMV